MYGSLSDHVYMHLEPVHNAQNYAAVFPECLIHSGIKTTLPKRFFYSFLKMFQSLFHTTEILLSSKHFSINRGKPQYPQTGKDI